MTKIGVTISIVGAGASGIISLNQLVEKFSPTSSLKITINIFDKSGGFGPGLVYSTPLNSHIINMNAATMSAVGGEPNHFVDWLKMNEHKIQKVYPHLRIDEKSYPPQAPVW